MKRLLWFCMLVRLLKSAKELALHKRILRFNGVWRLRPGAPAVGGMTTEGAGRVPAEWH